MATFVLFAFILFPFLLGVMSHLWSILNQKRRHNDLSTLTNSLTLKQDFPPFFIFEDRIIRHKINLKSMSEKREAPKAMRRKGSLLSLSMEEAQKQAEAQKEAEAQPRSTPTSPLKKSTNNRTNCLCSPTTHVGSFRCRLHRHGNKPGFRRGYSVGSDLSDLANKFSSKSNSSSSSLQMH